MGKHRIKGLAQDGSKGNNSVSLLQLLFVSAGVAIHPSSGGRLLISWLTGVIHMFPQWPHLTPFPSTSGKSGPPPLGQVEPPARCADRTVAHLWVPSGTGRPIREEKSIVQLGNMLYSLLWPGKLFFVTYLLFSSFRLQGSKVTFWASVCLENSQRMSVGG